MAGLAAYGTLLKIGDSSTGVAVANVTSIEGPGLSTETIDVTAHDSAGGSREEMPTFKSGGEVTLRINYDPAETTHKNAAGGLLKLCALPVCASYAGRRKGCLFVPGCLTRR